MSGSKYYVTSFYMFAPLSKEESELFSRKIEECATKNGIMGLVLVATEGCNGTVAGTPEGIEEIKNLLLSQKGFEQMPFKDSVSDVRPFRRLSIQLRDEIVALKKADCPMPPPRNHHLTPDEWDEMASKSESIMIDTRNWYETKIGKFPRAIDPGITHFSEWPKFLDSNEFPKDKNILIYCTGGIRCEKAILEMQSRGFDKVFQLDGGILQYLENKPQGTFEGECFVFDHRVAVDSNLAPTKQYKLCPHCGYPADITVTCRRCSSSTVICDSCQKDPSLISCSKNCAYHLDREAMKAASKTTSSSKNP